MKKRSGLIKKPAQFQFSILHSKGAAALCGIIGGISREKSLYFSLDSLSPPPRLSG
jgi:hypothetical protein